MIASHYRTVVIGSGFGGSVLSNTLAEAGEDVLLLERGPWRDTPAIRSTDVTDYAPFPRGLKAVFTLVNRLGSRLLPGNGVKLSSRGLFDIHLGKEMTVVCSNSVGGGSHVYSAMNVRPEKKDYWDGHAKQVSSQKMEEHYEWMIEKMGARRIIEADNVPNWIPEAFKDSEHFVASDTIEQPEMSMRLEGYQSDYKDNSFFGSANGAKASLDKVMLVPALSNGLVIADRHECLSIWGIAKDRYRLEVFDHKLKRRVYILADNVVLACGTLNTLRILFHSRSIGGLHGMPALGKGFAGNGDSVAWWALNDKTRDLSLGTPTHGRFGLRDPKTAKPMPGANLTRYGFSGIDQLPLPSFIKRKLKSDAVLVGMGADEANAVVIWSAGKMRINYKKSENPILDDVQRDFDEVACRSKSPVRYLKNIQLTVHPLGGARLSASVKDGVVRHDGMIHDHKNLYVVDASALPAAPGTPPSMTIAAWSRHVALEMLRKAKR